MPVPHRGVAKLRRISPDVGTDIDEVTELPVPVLDEGGWESNPGGGASRDCANAGVGAAARSALTAPAATVVVAMKSRRLTLF